MPVDALAALDAFAAAAFAAGAVGAAFAADTGGKGVVVLGGVGFGAPS